VFHGNVSSWSPRVGSYVEQHAGKYDVMMFCETHLTRPKMKAVQKRMAKIGYTALGEPAFLKDKGTSAGILILAPSRWSPVPLQSSIKAAVCQGSQLGRRWSAVFVRFTKTVVMFVEAYLVSGEGFRGQNLEILPAEGRPEGRFRCFSGSSPAKIRPGRPISGPDAILRNIE
jgi:hypothetical protein